MDQPMNASGFEIKVDDLTSREIAELLGEHLRCMAQVSPPESRHALDLDELRRPNITFWSVWSGHALAGCGALKEINPEHGEIKSMRTAQGHLRRGVASVLLQHIISEARRRRYCRLSLETGAMEYFEPARRLYRKAGFRLGAAFNGYVEDPNSVFMTMELDERGNPQGGMKISAEPPGSLFDLSHSIEHGMITYRGLPAPLICDYLSREASRQHYADGTEFQIGRIDMVANTGTYLDSPFHRFRDGKDLAELPLTSLAGLHGVVIRADKIGRTIGPDLFAGLELHNKAVLVHTGWDRHWRTDAYFESHPFLTHEAGKYLADAGARLVGIDSYNIDDTNDGRRPVHTVLLGNEIPIVEHMTGLHQLPAHGFQFFAVPPKIRAFGTFPVRAFARVD
jgi:kynurenine formamidase/GNAT superfamily N-acetyltransferase